MSEKISVPKPEMSPEELIRASKLEAKGAQERLLTRNESFPFPGIEEAA
jgi:hypothetical protein